MQYSGEKKRTFCRLLCRYVEHQGANNNVALLVLAEKLRNRRSADA
jgi:hypothetical protein